MGTNELEEEERVGYKRRKPKAYEKTEAGATEPLAENRFRKCQIHFHRGSSKERVQSGEGASSFSCIIASHTCCIIQICSEISYLGLSISLLAEIQLGFGISQGVNNRVCILVLYLLGVL